MKLGTYFSTINVRALFQKCILPMVVVFHKVLITYGKGA